MPKQGLHLIKPTTATATGTGSSATISTNGSVSFSTVTALQLEGIFSADYDNYQIVCRMTQSTADSGAAIQCVSGSTPDATTNYTFQRLNVSSTGVAGTLFTTASNATIGQSYTTLPNGFVLFVYGPNLAQPTVGRSLTVDSLSSARMQDAAWSHNVSSAFTGLKIIWGSGTAAGRVSVYGMRK